MDLREQLLARRKDTRWIVAALAGLLGVLLLIYYLIQRGQDLPPSLATNRVLLFALWYINLLLIIAIAFVLLRNLFKLLVDRRHGILGSKFKIKLVATYIILSLMPVILLFIYGSQLLQGWINQWFDEPAIQQVTEQGHAVAQELYRSIEERSLRDAARVQEEIRGFDLESTRRRPALARKLQSLLNDYDLDYLSIYRGSDFVHGVLQPLSGLRNQPDPGQRFLSEVQRRGEAINISQPSGQGQVILTAIAETTDGDEPVPIVIVGTFVAPELAGHMENLIQSYQGYRQLEVQKPNIETTYRLTFLMVTLIILLATSWVGLYLARRVTVPIEALAEATRRLSDGDLDHRVEVTADDELGVLVDSFNRMASELQRNKEELTEANRRLGDERAVVAAVLENVAAGVVSVDDEGRILTCNRAALRMLNTAERGIVGNVANEVWADQERSKLAKLFDEDPGPGGRLSRNLRLLLAGEWKNFEAKVRIMRDPDRR